MHWGEDRCLPRERIPRQIVASLATAVEPGLVASAGPRYFGFVVGGSLPAALAADWLTSAWDQNAFSYAASPAGSVVEETAGRWVRELLGLPSEASTGFTTGATVANVVGLAAARHAVLARAGWDVEERGLIGAPPIRVLAGDEVHASALQALRVVGLGTGTGALERVPVDGQGAMRADDAARMLRGTDGPAIVLAQAGNVNTGACDPLGEIVAAAHGVGAWVHVDGAFGMWAAASPRYRHLVAGLEEADSWALDCHKWLNVPYDCGFVAVRDREAHYAAMRMSAAYLVPAVGGDLDPFDWVPEGSPTGARHAGLRGIAVARPGRRCRPGRSLLLARAAHGRTPGGRGRDRDPERRRAQPGARPLRRRRCAHPRGHRCGAGGRHAVGRWHDVARPGRHAHLGLAAGRRPRRTSTGRPMRSSAAPRAVALTVGPSAYSSGTASGRFRM